MLLTLALLLQSPAGGSPSASFAAEAIRICVETRADPAAVRQLAEAEGWTAIDAPTTPGKASITLEGKKKKDNRIFNRNLAWTVGTGEREYIVGLFDFPEHPNVRQCDLIGWDLDFKAVDAAFRGDARFSGGEDMGLPMRMYRISGTASASAHYVQSDTGTKQLHLFAASPWP